MNLPVVVAMAIVNLDLTFHQHASTAIRKDAITDGRPLFGSGIPQLTLQLGNIGGFNELVLISLG